MIQASMISPPRPTRPAGSQLWLSYIPDGVLDHVPSWTETVQLRNVDTKPVKYGNNTSVLKSFEVEARRLSLLLAQDSRAIELYSAWRKCEECRELSILKLGELLENLDMDRRELRQSQVAGVDRQEPSRTVSWEPWRVANKVVKNVSRKLSRKSSRKAQKKGPTMPSAIWFDSDDEMDDSGPLATSDNHRDDRDRPETSTSSSNATFRSFKRFESFVFSAMRRLDEQGAIMKRLASIELPKTAQKAVHDIRTHSNQLLRKVSSHVLNLTKVNHRGSVSSSVYSESMQ